MCVKKNGLLRWLKGHFLFRYRINTSVTALPWLVLRWIQSQGGTTPWHQPVQRWAPCIHIDPYNNLALSTYLHVFFLDAGGHPNGQEEDMGTCKTSQELHPGKLWKWRPRAVDHQSYCDTPTHSVDYFILLILMLNTVLCLCRWQAAVRRRDSLCGSGCWSGEGLPGGSGVQGVSRSRVNADSMPGFTNHTWAQVHH